MRAALRGRYELTATDLPDETRQMLLKETEPLYWQIRLSSPVRQDGQEFSHLVAPFKSLPDLKQVQTGPGVLCQTEAEAKETFDNLRERDKKHLVLVQTAGFGIIGWSTNLRRFVNEIGVAYKKLPDGKMLWRAYERETDQDTLEVKLIRRKETNDEGEANYWARKWLDERNQQKKKFFDSVGRDIVPPPPPRCTPLTRTEIEDLGKAKLKALERQWPHCFEIFEKQKSNPTVKISDHEFEEAYILDQVGQGCDLWLAADGKKLRPDMELVSALHKAGQNYARRGKSKTTDAAIYLIAFKWELGWCYLSDEQLAKNLGELLETTFTAEQVKQYRYNTLGLYTKHKPGPPPNFS